MISIGNSQFDNRILGAGRTLTGASDPNALIPAQEMPAGTEVFNVQEMQRLREQGVKPNEVRTDPDKIIGQVIVNGEVFAAVYASGSAVTKRNMPMPDQGTGMALATARLNAIAKAVNGSIRQSDFLPNPWEQQPAGNAAGVAAAADPRHEFDVAQRRVEETLKAIHWRLEQNRS